MSYALTTLLSAVGPAAVGLALVVAGLLSKRLGMVTKMPPYYRWFFVAAGLLGGSTVTRLLSVGGAGEMLALLYIATFALGVTLGLVVVWHYWSWLFGERSG
jgi:hypothetical protein